jgi:hypothetical protein
MTADHILRKEILCPKSLVELIVWSIQEGSKVEKGQVIGKTGTIELGNQIQLFSPCKGTFCPIKFETEEIETKKKENEETVIGYVDYCIHPLKKGRVCMMCLQTVTEEEEMDHEKKSVKIVSNGQVLHVNMNHAGSIA